RQTLPVLVSLAKKMRAGKYDPARAPKAFEHVAEAGAKKYAKDFASPGDWSRLFSVATRRAVAIKLLEFYTELLEEMSNAVASEGSTRRKNPPNLRKENPAEIPLAELRKYAKHIVNHALYNQ